jgi:hypothetical protein
MQPWLRKRAGTIWVSWLVAAWAYSFYRADRGPFCFTSRLFDHFDNWQEHALAPWPTLNTIVDQIFHGLDGGVSTVYGWTFIGATILVPLTIVLRLAVRARLRAGQSDPLARARAWIASHPRTMSVALYGFALAIGALKASDWSYEVFRLWPIAVIASFLPLMVLPWIARAGLRACVAPIEVEEQEATLDKDAVTFAAVAVTRETRAAVGGLAVLSLLVAACIAVVPAHDVLYNPAVVACVIGYVAAAAAGAAVFRRASRISVGIDGVRVHGSSRSRFFAYRALDGARIAAREIQLVRGGRVVLRLQLHGKDAARRDALALRINEAITRAARTRDGAAERLADAADAAQITRALTGATDFRMPTVSRDALWEVVEGPTAHANARVAAAEALATSSDENERTRLRVAASQCAEPEARALLEQLTAEMQAFEDVTDARRRALR